MAKIQEQGYAFTLTRIEVTEKKINYHSDQSGSKDKYVFDIAMQVGQNPSSNDCIYLMKVTVKNKKSDEELATIVLNCVFNIPNYKQLVKDSNTDNPLPSDLMYLLNTVVIGTMRGVMFAEFRGTPLQETYLPVLDPSKFVKAE